MRYNIAEAPTKMGTFSQYASPNALSRYCDCARAVGVNGNTEKEIFEKFLEKIEALKETVGIPHTIQEYGIAEEDFLQSLDEMSEQAFDDQCTGANPRYPLIAEIRELYLDAYYGRTAKGGA
jgi:acetaldehyde dehydrogenase/alcohol dehydrogenase